MVFLKWLDAYQAAEPDWRAAASEKAMICQGFSD
jgi:hypothetical protein